MVSYTMLRYRRKETLMKSTYLVALLLLALLCGLTAPVSAAEPAAPTAPVLAAAQASSLPFAPFATAIPAASLCPTFFCPIFYPDDCSCDWIECPNGEIVCGRWNGTSAASNLSKVPALPFQF
jgi:hypothetical protein